MSSLGNSGWKVEVGAGIIFGEMRAFLAIELPAHVRQVVAEVQRGLRVPGVRASWVKPENFHLTLRFLGDIEPAQTEQLKGLLAVSCAALPPLRLRLGGPGCFPNARRPSVVWLGMEVESGDVGAVHRCCEAGARAVGLAPDEKRFHPHVTLARIRDHRHAGGISEALEACGPLHWDAFDAHAVALFESTLSPGGSIYRRVEEFQFHDTDH